MKNQHFKPIYRELIADLDTPASLYLKLEHENSFLLESISGGEQVARYSFIGFDPICELLHDGSKCTISFSDEYSENASSSERGDQDNGGVRPSSSIDALEELMTQFKVDKIPQFDHLVGGAVGYFSWETITEIEDIEKSQGPKTPFPQAHFMFPRYTIAFDHAHRKLILIGLAKADDRESINEVNSGLDDIETKIATPLSYTAVTKLNDNDEVFDGVSSNFSKDEFKTAVETAKRHIYEGDVFQLVLSQKFQIKSKKAPFDVYRALRSINPSPYMYYLNFADYTIIGSSPELLVSLDNNKVMVKPIAGTRKRDDSKEEAIIDELKTDDKECAEHIMLVDLGRNDIGRVCDYHSVSTSNLMAIEKYSHVYHMVSDVTGHLKEGKTAFDVFKATFPAGTLSGAPKVKAMEIINSLEPEQRGPYGGALGYFDFNGNMDLCIIIRTICVKGDTFYIQAGAGVVADSDPEKEYEETQNKARGVIKACL
jgi:anthranilate synthase component 1